MKTRQVLICVTLGISVVTGSFETPYKSSSYIFAYSKNAQFGNTISGYVFGRQRQPLSDITVELLDDYSRSIGRTRTNSSGKYAFSRMSSGRFKVRVLSFGTNYEEQEQEVEIQNISNSDSSGRIVSVSAYENVQRDFYLRERKSNRLTSRSGVIFVQEIPEKAREIYKKAIENLDNKNEKEGLQELKTAIEIFPDYYDALERLGTEYIRLKHFIPAQILLRKATQVNPQGYKSWYGLAYTFYSQNQVDDAIEAAQKANSLNEFSVESPLLTGVLLRVAKRFDEAEKQLKKAKELAKNSVPEVHWHLALLYGNDLKRYRDAANELELYLKVRPNGKDAETIKKLISDFKEKAKKS